MPLRIPWHPLTKKGHNFQSYFTYVSFKWDIITKSVSISPAKWLHLLSKFSVLLCSPTPQVNKRIIASIHGSLQHVTLLYLQGQGHLTALSIFLSKFPNKHILHHICLHQRSWWSQTLAVEKPSLTLLQLPELDLNIWVDASNLLGHWLTC